MYGEGSLLTGIIIFTIIGILISIKNWFAPMTREERRKLAELNGEPLPDDKPGSAYNVDLAIKRPNVPPAFCEACGAELKLKNVNNIGRYYFVKCENCGSSFYIKKKLGK